MKLAFQVLLFAFAIVVLAFLLVCLACLIFMASDIYEESALREFFRKVKAPKEGNE